MTPLLINLVWRQVEAVLEPFDVRPHWGKVTGSAGRSTIVSPAKAVDINRFREWLSMALQRGGSSARPGQVHHMGAAALAERYGAAVLDAFRHLAEVRGAPSDHSSVEVQRCGADHSVRRGGT